MSKAKRIPLEIKNQILERVKSSGKTIKEIASEHGISSVTIYTWLGENVGEISKREYLELKQQNQMMKEILGELTFKMTVIEKKDYRRSVRS